MGSLQWLDGRLFKLVKASEDIERRCEVEIENDGTAHPTRLLENKKEDDTKKGKGHNDTGHDIPKGWFFWCLVLGKAKDEKPLITEPAQKHAGSAS